MLLLISHRYPRLGAVLSAISSVVFLALGVTTHHQLLVTISVAGIALSAVQFTVRHRRAAQAR